jgi:EPS-associated MarR family transcriptional regulator
MTSRQAKTQQDTNFRVMRILQDSPDITQRELAEQLGISVGGLNYCLKALMDKGFVKMQNFSSSKNKFKYVYLLTPEPQDGRVRGTEVRNPVTQV